MDAYDDYVLNNHRRDVEMKEWLENHISLMRMDLDGMERSSPEYKKTLDIIESYESKLSDLQKDIDEFENS